MKLKKYLIESTRTRVLNEIFIQYKDLLTLPSVQRDMQMARLAMIAELDAANLYEAMAGQTSNDDLRDILLSVAEEEKQHSGEFEYILSNIDPDWEDLEDDGEDEAEDITK